MPKILIADDNQPNAELLEAHLDGSGFDTRIAINGEDTLKTAREWNPDVILLDVMMQKLSGFEVCQQLRRDKTTNTIGVLMVTALDQPTDVEKAVDAGTDDFLTKPINKTELLRRVKALIQSRGEASAVDRALAYIERVQQGA
jgi:two-component system alkaline phosphatase synthesis response regulator PhoP